MLNSHYFGNCSMQTKYLSFVMKHFLQSSKLRQENEHGSSMYTCLTISFSLFYSIYWKCRHCVSELINLKWLFIHFPNAQSHLAVLHTDFCLYLQGMVKVCVTSSRLCLHRKQQWLSPPWFPWCRIKLWDSSKGLRD